MALAVELLFDPTTEVAMKSLWARLERAGVPSLAGRTHRRHRPHISLSVAERIDTGQLQSGRDCLAAAHLDGAHGTHSPDVALRDQHAMADRQAALAAALDDMARDARSTAPLERGGHVEATADGPAAGEGS